MKKRLLLFLVSAIAALAAPGTDDPQATIESAEEITLYSIRPDTGRFLDDHGNLTLEEKKIERIHDFPVLGKIIARDSQTREAIRSAVRQVLRSEQEDPEPHAAFGAEQVIELGPGSKYKPPLQCFDPRHAVCFRTGDRHVDVLICFECGWAKLLWLDVVSADAVHSRESMVGISDDGRKTLDRLLDDRKIERDIPTKERTPNQTVEPTAPSGRGSP